VKVALVNGTRGFGGGERWFLEAAAALAARDHSVTLHAAPGDVLAQRAKQAGIPLAPVFAVDTEVCVLNSRRDLAAVLGAFRGPPPFRLVLRRGIDRPLHDGLFRRGAWKRLSAILANSEATAATIRRSLPWFPASRLRILPNPVAFAPAPSAPPSGDLLRIGAAGRLVRQKGFDVLLRALALLDDLPFRAEIAGDGKLGPRLRRLAGSLRLGPRVTFRGRLDDLAAFFASQDVIAVPSRYEGFCYVAAEAALAGLSVVASDVSSLREVVSHGETGLLLPPDDPVALAAALRDLARDPARRRELGGRAREQARRRFSPEPIYDALIQFLAEAAGLPPVGGKE
jgi:glycosyltransferase involved in cell wall biosynthesis